MQMSQHQKSVLQHSKRVSLKHAYYCEIKRRKTKQNKNSTMHGVQIENKTKQKTKQGPCGSLLSLLEIIPASNYKVVTTMPSLG